MERLTCPFYPLKNTAKEVYNETELTEKINVGVLVSEWTEQRQSMFDVLVENMRIGLEENGNNKVLTFDGVPVHMKIIERKYKFFEKPDVRFFGVNEFLIPNPLDGYLKSQHLIK